MAKKKRVKRRRSHQRPGQVFRFFQAPEPGAQPVAEGLRVQVDQRADHGVSRGSPVARQNTSSRFASWNCAENVCRISTIVPSITLRPLFRIRTCEQISSSKCSRCELMM